MEQTAEHPGIDKHPPCLKLARGWRKLEVDPCACRRSHSLEVHAPRALPRIHQMQREEMTEKGHGRGNAHHGLTHKGEDGNEGHGLGVKMQQEDLIVFQHCVEEGGERGTRPAQRASMKSGTLVAARSMRARELPALIETGGEHGAHFAHGPIIEHQRSANRGLDSRRHVGRR